MKAKRKVNIDTEKALNDCQLKKKNKCRPQLIIEDYKIKNYKSLTILDILQHASACLNPNIFWYYRIYR